VKLSTAMYKGAKLRPQGVGGYFPVGARAFNSDAVGAAIEAKLGNLPYCLEEMHLSGLFEKLFPSAVHKYAVHPVTQKQQTVRTIAVSLNDDHKWRRERIAAWLRTLGY